MSSGQRAGLSFSSRSIRTEATEFTEDYFLFFSVLLVCSVRTRSALLGGSSPRSAAPSRALQALPAAGRRSFRALLTNHVQRTTNHGIINNSQHSLSETGYFIDVAGSSIVKIGNFTPKIDGRQPSQRVVRSRR